MVPPGLFPAESSLLGKDSPPTPTMYKYRPGYSSSSTSAAMPHSSSAKVLSSPEEAAACPGNTGTGRRGGGPGWERNPKAFSCWSALVGLRLLDGASFTPRGPGAIGESAEGCLRPKFKPIAAATEQFLTSLRLIPCVFKRDVICS